MWILVELKRIKILFVAFEFPPLASGGVQRSLKFVKYLPQYGIDPVVVTVLEEDYPLVIRNCQLDRSQIEDLPAGISIERIHCAAAPPPHNAIAKWFSMYFSISENYKKYWREGLEMSLPGIIKKYDPQLIYLTIPPFALATLWRKLLQKHNIPLLVDFRDAWSQWSLAPNGSYFHYVKKLAEENKILNKAAAVITTTAQTRNDLLLQHKNVAAHKVRVIPNGYDELLNIGSEIKVGNNKKIRIGYVGSFYYSPGAREAIMKPWWKKKPHRMLNYTPRKEDWLYRSPFFFFQSIQELFKQKPEWKERIEISFAGRTPDWLSEQIAAFGLTENCSHTGFLNRREVESFQESCDVLLSTSAKVINGEDYSIAGKTFEYFTAGKPILAFVCNGAQKDILEESGMAILCDPDAPEKNTVALDQLFSGKTILRPSIEKLKQYHRKELTGLLAEVVKSTIETSSGTHK